MGDQEWNPGEECIIPDILCNSEWGESGTDIKYYCGEGFLLAWND
jgi:hypothetical protein